MPEFVSHKVTEPQRQDCRPEMFYFKAAPEYEERWLEAARKGLRNLAAGDVAMYCEATVIRIEAATPVNKFYLAPDAKGLAGARA